MPEERKPPKKAAGAKKRPSRKTPPARSKSPKKAAGAEKQPSRKTPPARSKSPPQAVGAKKRSTPKNPKTPGASSTVRTRKKKALRVSASERKSVRKARPYQLTKTNFVLGWFCPLYLWRKVHEPKAPELKPDRVTLDRFRQGRDVGVAAQEQFDGVLITGSPDSA